MARRRIPVCTTTAKGGPRGLPFAALLCAALGALLPAVSAAAASPIFRPGYDLCRAVPLAAVRHAGGQRYRAGIFAAGACTWERSDLRAGITFSTHPPRVGAELIRMFLARGHGARTVAVHGAKRAVLVPMATGAGQEASTTLLASYRGGTIQLGMTAPGALPLGRLLAVLRLVAPG